MQSSLPKRDIVLLGAGHTHAHILRMWRMEPVAEIGLTCVSNFPVATYSGMLPGVLAGQYSSERMEIDLVRLCAAANARLIVGHVIGLDRDARQLLFDDRPPLHFDVLSVGIGSVPNSQGVARTDPSVVTVNFSGAN
jgi:selenide,water dikinase